MRQSKISRRSFLLGLVPFVRCGADRVRRGQRFLQRTRLLFPARRARILGFH